MSAITFIGATGTVTGSRFLLELEKETLLIDCGLFQGKKEHRLKNWEFFYTSPYEIDRVLLTHAHIDHSGYIPRLCHDGFEGPIHCTYATYDLCDILLKDSAHIQEEDARWANKRGYSKHEPALPLYTVQDAKSALKQFQPQHYGDDLYIQGEYRIKFKDAGHLLGSSFVDIKKVSGNKSRKILFSGDIGRPDPQFLREPSQLFNVDYLVLESTYGNRLHERVDTEGDLVRIINESMGREGVLIIPSFAIGRTQTLLYMLRELEEQKLIPSLPVYVDSPMAIDATGIFKRRISDQSLTSRLLTLQGKKIFQPAKLQLCTSRQKSIELNKIKKDAIIIASSGMATGGRVLHHLALRLPDERNTVLFSGHQVTGTRGRHIVEGNPTVKIHGEEIPINAKIESLKGLSGHADYNEILAWLIGFNKPPDKTFIVHGEPEASQALAEKIKGKLGWDVTVPQPEESYEIEL
ncbi:MAG: MBL fold metallo-hydrolase [candidate division Zixibacteria bacterium]|nr:MBL fold metallo-hydrolase [candidate division Zixibacteria bacterium]